LPRVAVAAKILVLFEASQVLRLSRCPHRDLGLSSREPLRLLDRFLLFGLGELVLDGGNLLLDPRLVRLRCSD